MTGVPDDEVRLRGLFLVSCGPENLRVKGVTGGRPRGSAWRRPTNAKQLESDDDPVGFVEVDGESLEAAVAHHSRTRG